MAQLIFSHVGGYIGGQVAPQGISILGQQITGQAIGSYVGSLAGSAIDAYLFAPRQEGPRISQFHVTQSNEGAPIPNVYGRLRLGCNVIWAARFDESREKSGKGGPKTTTYSYSLSFAVGLCEGEISRVSRAWANGSEFDLSSVNSRLYRGTEDQAPDPLIETIEGFERAPAYKGLAYIVFEDLPLDEFGARIPQMSFEVMRSVGGEDRLETIVDGMNLIPGSGEFAYANDIIRREIRLGVQEPENQHSGSGDADFLVSLDQLVQDFPNLSHVNLIVGWFGTSTDCANCEIRPGVERRDRRTKPRSWTVAGLDRESAYLVSTDGQGRPNYGGTPEDASIIQAIQALKARGLKVTLYPFLFMDEPGLPWRGRVTCDPAIDASAAANDSVAAFFGEADQWRYRRFIRHYAELAVEAGGVEAFLIGSELVGLTRIRSAPGVYPAVSQLKSLAGEIRAIVGVDTKISYAADWTEYGAHLPQDGSQDVDFPLDDLWADSNIDFVGLDWYPPMGDWRDAEQHLDMLDGFRSAEDPAYLRAQIEGGEGYDYFYADQSRRDAQIRTPILDTSHGEDWIFRQKDIRNWWSKSHYSRPGGIRNSAPTAWSPGMKPVRFVEFGCPAIDRGANQPNVFFDPKSDESAIPHYSSGARDDVIQRRAIEAFCRYWADDPMLDESGVAVWAWDMRPYPVWPLNTDLWSDGGNWRFGHWLNGRAGAAQLSDVVSDLSGRAGLSPDVAGLNGLVSGFALDGVHSLRDALEPLRTAFDIRTLEDERNLKFSNSEPVFVYLSTDDLVMPDTGAPIESARSAMEPKASHRFRMNFIDSEANGQVGVVLSSGEADAPIRDLSLPLLLDRDQAQLMVEHLAEKSKALQDAVSLTLSPTRLDIETGDMVSIDGAAIQVLSIQEGAGRRIETVRRLKSSPTLRNAAAPSKPGVSHTTSEPVIAIVDAPPLPGEENDARPLVFAAAHPWTGPVGVAVGVNEILLTLRCTIDRPCIIGELIADAPLGAPWRWSTGAMDVQIITGALSSVDQTRLFNGANAALLETPAGWEMFQFLNAELTGDHVWRLSGLLRGQQGSERLLVQTAESGSRIVVLTGAEQRMEMSDHDYESPLMWRAGKPDADENAMTHGIFNSDKVAIRQWAPAQLRAEMEEDSLNISWLRRGRRGGDGWGAAEPLHDGPEVYQVQVVADDTVKLMYEVSERHYVLSAQELDMLGSEFEIHVAQLGSDQRPGFAAKMPVTNSP